MLARMVFTSSYGASTEFTFVESMVQTSPSNETLAPSLPSTSANVRVSRRSGTFRSLWTPGAISVAAITGSAAFFAPLMATRPDRRRPPWMTSASMGTFSVARSAGGIGVAASMRRGSQQEPCPTPGAIRVPARVHA